MTYDRHHWIRQNTPEDIREVYRKGRWIDRGGGIHEQQCNCRTYSGQGKPRGQIEAYPQLRWTEEISSLQVLELHQAWEAGIAARDKQPHPRNRPWPEDPPGQWGNHPNAYTIEGEARHDMWSTGYCGEEFPYQGRLPEAQELFKDSWVAI